jgi:hypothetical protein
MKEAQYARALKQLRAAELRKNRDFSDRAAECLRLRLAAIEGAGLESTAARAAAEKARRQYAVWMQRSAE